MMSRTARATSAACVLCGAALLYARHKRQQLEKVDPPTGSDQNVSGWLQFVNWSIFSYMNDSSTTAVKPPESALRQILYQWRALSSKEDQLMNGPYYVGDYWPRLHRKSCHALHELALLTKDEKYCDRFLQLTETVENLIRLVVTHSGELDHEVECLIAEILANLSSNDYAKSIFYRCDMTKCVDAWLQRADSSRLSLCAHKIHHNCTGTDGTILNGSVYHFQRWEATEEGDDNGIDEEAATAPEIDVVFVNGINGSVFYTWRPRHGPPNPRMTKPPKSKQRQDPEQCWPTEWLSADLPSARLIGVDMPIRAWSWNPASSNQHADRRLMSRSTRLLGDMERAGVGRGGRPVVWVTHSMGGLLVKEMLRQAEEAESPVHTATRGVLFMSTPHRGSTSLRALFYFPFRLALSLESRELTMNSQPLCELDAWFREYAASRQLYVVDMLESLPTQINRIYSVVLVRQNGQELGEVVTVPCDHVKISKPVDKSDLIYTTVKSFVEKCMLPVPATTS